MAILAGLDWVSFMTKDPTAEFPIADLIGTDHARCVFTPDGRRRNRVDFTGEDARLPAVMDLVEAIGRGPFVCCVPGSWYISRLDVMFDARQGLTALAKSCLEDGSFKGVQGGRVIESYTHEGRGRTVYFGSGDSQWRIYDGVLLGREHERFERQVRGAGPCERIASLLASGDIWSALCGRFALLVGPRIRRNAGRVEEIRLADWSVEYEKLRHRSSKGGQG